MNFLSRLIVLLVLSISFTAPAGAAVAAMEISGWCDVIAADDDKTDDDKKPGEGDAEPECD